jgi:hypothetical protein
MTYVHKFYDSQMLQLLIFVNIYSETQPCSLPHLRNGRER